MILVRSGSVALVLAASLVAIGCGSSSTSPDTAASLTPASTSEDSSALVLSKVDGAAKLDIAAEGGACTDIRTLIEGKKTELQALCADKQIPVPVAHDDEGCEAGSAKKITFECLAVKIPPMPAEGCRDIEVKDDGKAIPEGSELPDTLVCPRLGGAPPTDEAGEAGGEGSDGASRPKPPMPTGDRPQPPMPPRDGADGGAGAPKPPAGGPNGQGPKGEGADGKQPPLPPKGIKCCAPPPGGKAPEGAKAPQAK